MDESTRKLIDDYQTPESVIDRLKDIQTVILTGITGAGKDTIIRSMLGDARFNKVITSTTRVPRENNGIMENDGVDFYFLSQEQALRKIQDGSYIEVNNVHGLIYGSLIEEYERIDSGNHIALTTIDYQGADNFLGFGMNNLTVIFVIPPDFDTWLERISGRHGGTLEGRQDEILKRLLSADKEITHALNDPRFIPVMNIDIEECAKDVIDIAIEGRVVAQEDIARSHAALRALHLDLQDYIKTVKSN
jgi:guanylate kinase